MNCRDFADHLDALIDDSAPRAVIDAAHEHRRGCRRCADLWRVMSGESSESDDPFVKDVLLQTAGRSCEADDERLLAYVDGSVDVEEKEIVEGHIAGCPHCRGFVVAARWTDDVVSRVETADPGADFVAEVVARTTEAPRSMTPSWWGRWTRRPFFAMEFAYVATALFLLVLGPERMANELKGVDSAVIGPVGAFRQELVSTGSESLPAEIRSGAEEALRRGALAVDSAKRAGGHIGNAISEGFRGDVDDAAWQLTMVGGDLTMLWRALAGDIAAFDDTTGVSQ